LESPDDPVLWIGYDGSSEAPADSAHVTIFRFQYSRSTPTSCTLVATGKGPMVGFTYTIDQANTKTTTSPWGNGNCWITKLGEPC
jgi:type IV pilus assembly protein PilE